jgi:predicted kinase
MAKKAPGYAEYMSDQSTSGPRSVKIGADERTGWSSDRPRGGPNDRPPRPVDISTRCRTIKPSDRMRYSPGSLVVVVSASSADRDRFVNRVFEEQGAVLGIDKLKSMVAGKVDESALDATAKQLLDATIAKRLEKGDAVVLPTASLDVEEREPYVRLAHKFRRPRHLILIETAKDKVAEEDVATLNELRRQLDAGELGAEGFQTAMRLGGSSVTDLKRIVFRPAPRDDD